MISLLLFFEQNNNTTAIIVISNELIACQSIKPDNLSIIHRIQLLEQIWIQKTLRYSNALLIIFLVIFYHRGTPILFLRLSSIILSLNFSQFYYRTRRAFFFQNSSSEGRIIITERKGENERERERERERKLRALFGIEFFCTLSLFQTLVHWIVNPTNKRTFNPFLCARALHHFPLIASQSTVAIV